MYTIKEVAAAAGVSVGSVSNVINGKTKNVELIQRVEKAIETLSYRPDANARSLKNTRSSLIGIILPDLIHLGYSIFLSSIEEKLRDKGYGVLLALSRNNKDIEKECLKQCLEKRVDGIIVYSAVDARQLRSMVGGHVPVVCITQDARLSQEVQSVRVDYIQAFREALASLDMKGIRNIGVIADREMLAVEEMEKFFPHVFGRQNGKYIRMVDKSRERAFKACYELIFNHPEIESIIAGSPLIAEGVAKALDILQRQEVLITAVKDGNWIEDESGFSSFVSLSHESISATAVNSLLDLIEDRPTAKTSVVAAKYEVVQPLVGGLSRHSGKIHFAMFDCPSAHALEMLSGVYSRQSGVNVSFDFLSYAKLEALLHDRTLTGEYDGFMFDVVWLRDLAENGVLFPLEGYLGLTTPVNSGFLDGVLEQYSVYDNILFGLPFMSGAELMYYQKNLFEDSRLQRLYQSSTGKSLKPPSTWVEFNAVAKFFTREFNSESPVEYGMATVYGKNVFTPVAFLPYLWSCGGDLFDKCGNVAINTGEALEALKLYLEGFAYSKISSSWGDVARQFQVGACAMAILYDSHAVDLNDYTKSSVAGNIGYTTIPGRVSVMGGWNLGLNPEARNRTAVIEFVRWACGDQSAMPLSLLGGSPLRKICFDKEDILRIYPWKAITVESHSLSRQRLLPNSIADKVSQHAVYVDILANVITRCIRGSLSPEKALGEMEKKLLQLRK